MLARTAGACGEGGELALDFLRVTGWALQIGVGVADAAQPLEHLSTALALVLIQGHSVVLLNPAGAGSRVPGVSKGFKLKARGGPMGARSFIVNECRKTGKCYRTLEAREGSEQLPSVAWRPLALRVRSESWVPAVGFLPERRWNLA